jgi:tRNA(Ile)-lysidine synthase
MLSKLKEHLHHNLPFLQEKKLLIAVSGGIDSIVLLRLLQRLNYDIAIAHCNFSLRGDESDSDEKFVSDYALQHNVKLHVTTFDTKRFAADSKVSIQIAARQLRYAWFNELLKNEQLDYLLTAHHLDDSVETFLINFTRGTGLEGLVGIPGNIDKIVRPLLPFTRTEIEAYAAENSILWREDSSNASTKYLRNKIRHDVVPVLKSLNPSFANSFTQTIASLKQAQSMVEDAAVIIYRQVVTDFDDQKRIDILQLKRLPNYKAYLYQWLNPLGFTAWDDVYNLVDAMAGKYVTSANYRILKDRDVLIVEPSQSIDLAVYEIAETTAQIAVPIALNLQVVDSNNAIAKKGSIFVDKELIKFPLLVRKWQEGEYFYPAGMNGLKKKVSKYFKDEKMSLSDKESTWLLCSENDIIWIIGKRADERFKVTDATTQILKIEVL